MVNYVLSFCKITGASKIFQRNFYLPLLKPVTPREALRTLRITGKWLLGAAKRQHYIPVLLHHTEKKPIDSNGYGKTKHIKCDEYTYMTPTLDTENELHNILLKILHDTDNKELYVYTVEDKKYNIVFSNKFEIALRNGEIIDVLISQKNDKIILKLKDRKKIPIEIQYFEGDEEELFCGEAATDEEQEQFHHHGKYTMGLAKIFEEKEMREEKWEEELKKILKRRKKQKWENSKAYKEMMKRNMKNMNWDKFEEEAKKVIDEISEPGEDTAIEMEVNDLEATKNVNETILSRGPELLNQLPTLMEIPDLIKSMGNASLHEIENNSIDNSDIKRGISGVKVTLPSGKECFVSGQMVFTEEGEVFVPGQTVNNEFGDEYIPGITTNINNQPTLVNGLILGEEESNPIFMPSQAAITTDGTLTFSSNPEERPPPPPESERKVKRTKKQPETIPEEILDENGFQNFKIINLSNISGESDCEEKSTEMSSDDLNSLELQELDIEAMRLRQEQHRLELEQLKQQLFDDMSDIISNLEDKKDQINKKLEELRRQHIDNQNNLVTYVNEKDAMEIASKITDDTETIIRLSDILLTMTRRSSTFRDKNSVRLDNINLNYAILNPSDADLKFGECTNKFHTLYKTALVAANDVFKQRPKDQLLALVTIANIISGPLKSDRKLLTEFTAVMKTQFDREEICKAAFKHLVQIVEDTKIAMLTKLVEEDMTTQDFLEIVGKILEPNNIMNISFNKIVKINSGIVRLVTQNIEELLQIVSKEDDAVSALKKSIVNATKDIILQKYVTIRDSSKLGELIEEATCFAKALDLDEIVDDLSNPLIEYNERTIDMLKRMVLIKQLAERDYSLKTAIIRIKKNCECAKSDPRIRQLVRESAVLISDLHPLYNSRSIPLYLMKKQNLLAIEDYLIRKSDIDYPVLISRSTLQAVIPKDASRGVLAGRIPYVLLDETGATHFKPMHMISAIHVNKNREKRIDDYLNGVRERSTDRDNTSSYLKAKSNVRRLKKLLNNRKAA